MTTDCFLQSLPFDTFFYGKQARICILRWHHQMEAIMGTVRHCAVNVIMSDSAQQTLNSGFLPLNSDLTMTELQFYWMLKIWASAILQRHL